MSAKIGDHVISWNADEGLIDIGMVSEIHNEDECDLEFYGGGSVSPVGLKECIVVPEPLARFLSGALDLLPLDEEGIQRLPQDI